MHVLYIMLDIVDNIGFENLVDPVNVCSKPSDHSTSHNKGKMLIIMQ